MISDHLLAVRKIEIFDDIYSFYFSGRKKPLLIEKHCFVLSDKGCIPVSEVTIGNIVKSFSENQIDLDRFFLTNMHYAQKRSKTNT